MQTCAMRSYVHVVRAFCACVRVYVCVGAWVWACVRKCSCSNERTCFSHAHIADKRTPHTRPRLDPNPDAHSTHSPKLIQAVTQNPSQLLQIYSHSHTPNPSTRFTHLFHTHTHNCIHAHTHVHTHSTHPIYFPPHTCYQTKKQTSRTCDWMHSHSGRSVPR
jgi:hypothetical protein